MEGKTAPLHRFQYSPARCNQSGRYLPLPATGVANAAAGDLFPDHLGYAALDQMLAPIVVAFIQIFELVLTIVTVAAQLAELGLGRLTED